MTDAATLEAAGLAAAFTGAALDAGVFTVTFFVTAFLAMGLLGEMTFFEGDLAATFLATALATGFLAATDFLEATFFTAARLATLAGELFFVAGFEDVFFADVLVALFTAAPFLATAFDTPPLASCRLTFCALTEVDPLSALVAFALCVVFAISLHRYWP